MQQTDWWRRFHTCFFYDQLMPPRTKWKRKLNNCQNWVKNRFDVLRGKIFPLVCLCLQWQITLLLLDVHIHWFSSSVWVEPAERFFLFDHLMAQIWSVSDYYYLVFVFHTSTNRQTNQWESDSCPSSLLQFGVRPAGGAAGAHFSLFPPHSCLWSLILFFRRHSIILFISVFLDSLSAGWSCKLQPSTLHWFELVSSSSSSSSSCSFSDFCSFHSFLTCLPPSFSSDHAVEELFDVFDTSIRERPGRKPEIYTRSSHT